MIIICPNTRIFIRGFSKEVYKYIAGYEKIVIDKEANNKIEFVDGTFPLFNNHNSDYQIVKEKPVTLLIDSNSLKDANDKIEDSFRKVFAGEIAKFEKDHKRNNGASEAPTITYKSRRKIHLCLRRKSKLSNAIPLYSITEIVDTITTKQTIDTIKSHINKVVADTDEWKQIVATNLEAHAAV